MNVSTESTMYEQIEKTISENLTTANENLAWLQSICTPISSSPWPKKQKLLPSWLQF